MNNQESIDLEKQDKQYKEKLRSEKDGLRYYNIETSKGQVEQYPSVTSILDSVLSKGKYYELWLMKNTEQESKDISDKAKSLGSRIHEKIEEHIKQKIEKFTEYVKPTLSEDEEPLFQQFLAWENKYQPIWKVSEKVVWDDLREYAGTLDAVAIIDNKYYVVDFKTSKKIYYSMGIQGGAYSHAWNQERKADIGILRLDKKGSEYEWKTFDFKVCVNLFWNVLSIFKYKQKFVEEKK